MPISNRLNQMVKLKDPQSLEKNFDKHMPVRITRGPMVNGIPESKLPEQDENWYHSAGRALRGNIRFEIVNFINGKRTILEIRNAVSAEYETIETDIVAHYIEDLVRTGVLKWN